MTDREREIREWWADDLDKMGNDVPWLLAELDAARAACALAEGERDAFEGRVAALSTELEAARAREEQLRESVGAEAQVIADAYYSGSPDDLGRAEAAIHRLLAVPAARSSKEEA